MKVFYKKGAHVIVLFPAHELKQALGVLKALAQFFKEKFIFDVAKDLENDLTPKLAYTSYHSLCIKCACELDKRDRDTFEIEGRFFHRVCPTLKPDSQRER